MYKVYGECKTQLILLVEVSILKRECYIPLANYNAI